MRWLHLSDLHFQPTVDGFSTSQLRDKLLVFLRENNITVDYIFLTGDYRQASNQQDDLTVTLNDVVNYVLKIAEIVSVTAENIFCIPGNHDLNRFTTEEEKNKLAQIVSNYDPTDGKLDSENKDFLWERFLPFHELCSTFLSKGVQNHFSNLTHPYICKDDVSILLLNSCLTCNGKKDRGQLLLFTNELYTSLSAIAKQSPHTPIIILSHHELNMLQEDELTYVNTLLKDYSILAFLCGDSHKHHSLDRNFIEITSGCLLYHDEVNPFFNIGGFFQGVTSVYGYDWEKGEQCWKPCESFNHEISGKLGIATNYICDSMNIFPSSWFLNHNNKQIENLGSRYSPEVHVPLEMSEIFEFLFRTEEFSNVWKDRLASIFDEYTDTDKDLSDYHESLSSYRDKFLKFSNEFNSSPIAPLQMSDGKILCEELGRFLDSEINPTSDDTPLKDPIRSKLLSLRTKCTNLSTFLSSAEVQAACSPYLYIYGEGGTGKSHLLADFVLDFGKRNFQTIFLLGQQFSESIDLDTQILSMIGENMSTMKNFLSKLNRTGEINKRRVVIVIDALNEGNGYTLWKNRLAGFLTELKNYSWLGLVVSLRSEYKKFLVDDIPMAKKTLIPVPHHGFQGDVYEAIEKYFTYYGLVASTPVLVDEFKTPLFLSIFCKSYQLEEVDWSNYSITSIFDKFIKKVNQEIMGDECYSNPVEVALSSLAIAKYNKSDKVISVSKGDSIIREATNNLGIPTNFFSRLIASGILTKNIKNGTEYVHITYEKIEDYLVSIYLVEHLNNEGADGFLQEHSIIVQFLNIFVMFAVVLAEKTELEIFDIFDPVGNFRLSYAFLHSLKWRNANTFSEKTKIFLLEQMSEPFDHPLAFEVLFTLVSRKKHPLNSEFTVGYIKNFEMPQRDGLFIPLFHALCSHEYVAIQTLLEWSFNKKVQKNISADSRYLTSLALCTFLISSNNTLRDRATRGLVLLLSENIEILLRILEYFEDFYDPYVSERLYAVAFGVITVEKDTAQIKLLGEYVYQKIFLQDEVYPNVLLRDYCSNVVKYASYRCSDFEIDESKINTPYGSKMPEIPSDSEIDEYVKAYDSNAVGEMLLSMQTEYHRNGKTALYGDFGRYVFQSYFKYFADIDVIDMKNIAIQRIFTLGYSEYLHGSFEFFSQYDPLTKKRKTGREPFSMERIGKKYQWIAFYELAAQVADNYNINALSTLDSSNNPSYRHSVGSLEPDIRNIDPTTFLCNNSPSPNQNLHNSIYTLPYLEDAVWLNDFQDHPSTERLLTHVLEGEEFILLNGQYQWNEGKSPSPEDSGIYGKDVWCSINSYLIRNVDVDACIDYLKNKDFYGRWLNDPTRSTLFNREYYWSEGYNFYNFDYNWGALSNKKDCIDIAVMLTTCEYGAGCMGNELPDGKYPSWKKPCSLLFHGLSMQYGGGDSILNDECGNVVAFDSKELLGEKIGLFIKKESLMEYLEKNNLTVLWTTLSEKWAFYPRSSQRTSYNRLHRSTIVTLDSEGMTYCDPHDEIEECF